MCEVARVLILLLCVYCITCFFLQPIYPPCEISLLEEAEHFITSTIDPVNCLCPTVLMCRHEYQHATHTKPKSSYVFSETIFIGDASPSRKSLGGTTDGTLETVSILGPIDFHSQSGVLPLDTLRRSPVITVVTLLETVLEQAPVSVAKGSVSRVTWDPLQCALYSLLETCYSSTTSIDSTMQARATFHVVSYLVDDVMLETLPYALREPDCFVYSRSSSSQDSILTVDELGLLETSADTLLPSASTSCTASSDKVVRTISSDSSLSTISTDCQLQDELNTDSDNANTSNKRK